jgi:small subunit ribosomal protein S16
MLMIRLQRVGRKNEPVFRLVLTDSKNSTKSGKYLEVLGSYDPRNDNKIEQFNIVKIKELMSKGAKLSDTVHNFLVSRKAIEGKKKNVLPKKTPIKAEAPAEATKPTAAPVEAPKA